MRATLTLLIFMATTVSTLVAQARPPSKNEVYEGLISSQEGRDWIIEAWGTRLGVETGCTQGVSWVFFSNGQLIKRTCVNGKLQEQEHKWSINATESGPMELTIDQTIHWIEILVDKIDDPGLPQSEVLIAKIQEIRNTQEERALTYILKRTKEGSR